MTDHVHHIERFVQSATQCHNGAAARVALFRAIRDLPYATDGAHDAVTLVRLGRGDCLAKADLLLRGLGLLGYQARRVRWLYHLPNQPPEVALLPSREDVHTAVEVEISECWLLVDATHDPPLMRGGLTVSEWDGIGETVPAYPPQGPLWREGRDDAMIANALATIATRFTGLPSEHGASYRRAFNAWLTGLRKR
jgi:hypothetical protein